MRPIGIYLSIVLSTFGQESATRIGNHQMRETIAQWQLIEPNTPPPPPLPNPLAPHELGEPFTTWLTLNHLDLVSICGPHKRGDNAVDWKRVCANLTKIQQTQQGEFYTKNEAGTIGWRFTAGTLSAYQLNSTWHTAPSHPTTPQDSTKLVTRANARAYTWEFSSSELSRVTVTPDWTDIYSRFDPVGLRRNPNAVPQFSNEVRLLSQLYGPPKLEQVSYQNAYGSQWSRERATWNQPDGTLIIAIERTGFDEGGQLEAVIFTVAPPTHDSPTSNPYSSPLRP